MSRQNHYQTLGVSSDADAAQIRAAYVVLLKRHHPDQAKAREMPENGPPIERIIAAYRTLKDPASRARYDAALPRAAPPPLATKNPSSAFVREFRRATSRWKLDPEAISYAVMLVIAAVGLHLVVSRLIQEPRASGKALPARSSLQEIDARTQLEAAVRNAGMMSRAEASNFSARCFAAAGRGRNPAATDTCIGFDMAYVYWRDTIGGPLASDPYFQPRAMDSRFRAALGRLNATKAATRVGSIRAATLRAILQTPRPTDEFGFSLAETRSSRPITPAKQQTAGTSQTAD
jgi:hypothetical protein